ncbi:MULTISPECIES: L-rhamnose mutarotase [Enterococcus]|uniref:L-rhamnose mutarotase n=1 Tax=Candidatus Enterococcus murrayae TaxID=2815321 RepID=A0ABS3HFU4_9ENTE|nr:L-rhamnose mutarotase [Enterococcus sp. MJM16]MBO0451458.1 L-rhamnose mutarotase [Enterococcus sp. MJM16]
MTVTRYGAISTLKPESKQKYIELHANAWPKVNEMIKKCNLQNYSIYQIDNTLFSYYEYTGDDYDADMAKMAADKTTQEWWDECIPCMKPLDGYGDEGVWTTMKEIYHLN